MAALPVTTATSVTIITIHTELYIAVNTATSVHSVSTIHPSSCTGSITTHCQHCKQTDWILLWPLPLQPEESLEPWTMQAVWPFYLCNQCIHCNNTHWQNRLVVRSVWPFTLNPTLSATTIPTAISGITGTLHSAACFDAITTVTSATSVPAVMILMILTET